MDNQPILSLCIPTNGAVECVLPVIESIYSQGYDDDKFEVVITDNGKDRQLPQHIAKMNYPNLYYRQTTDKGFLNLVTCLKEGKGLFIVGLALAHSTLRNAQKLFTLEDLNFGGNNFQTTKDSSKIFPRCPKPRKKTAEERRIPQSDNCGIPPFIYNI